MKKFRALGVLILIAIVLLPSSDTTIDSHERSIAELARAGFYAYILPSTYQPEAHWQRVIEMWSFDYQCSNFFKEDTWNPIWIRYIKRDASEIELRISNQDALWDLGRPAKKVALDAAWTPSREAEYYSPDGGGTYLHIKDRFGMDVVISSWLPPETLVDFAEHLEYAGPDPATVQNPWDAYCKQNGY